MDYPGLELGLGWLWCENGLQSTVCAHPASATC